MVMAGKINPTKGTKIEGKKEAVIYVVSVIKGN
jgi:hypothetical protein